MMFVCLLFAGLVAERSLASEDKRSARCARTAIIRPVGKGLEFL